MFLLAHNNLDFHILVFRRQLLRKTSQLKALMQKKAAIIVPGVANALFARVVEELEYECAYVTGAGIANMQFGVPDIGLTTLTDVVNSLSAISDSVDIPLIVDADTGFGNAVNVYRTVRLLERAGAAAIQLEDQVLPKKCGHFAGKAVVSCEEMVQKVKAAVDARQDDYLLIIARTDALAVEGIDRAIDRAHAFVAAGADMTFVEAPTDVKQLAEIPAKIAAPQVVNIVFGGKTPALGRAQLADMGFSLVLYANAVLQAALHASYEVLGSLRDTGSLSAVASQLASFEERQRTVRKDVWDDREEQYGTDNE
jgi:2-methylisocitrate lyase-like PEP mutase family enzyme